MIPPCLSYPHPMSLNFLSILLLKATFYPSLVQIGVLRATFIISWIK